MRAAVRQVFGAVAAGYGRENPLLVVERPETTALLPTLSDKVVLDVGAGPGYYAALAAARGARLALALDLTAEMAARAPRPGVVADALRLPLRGQTVDVIVAALVISFVESRRALFEEAGRVLKPGGVVVVSDLHSVATSRGWRRTFESASGRRLALEAPPPATGEVCAEMNEAGLTVDQVREAVVDERLQDAFVRGGRRDFPALRGTPLLSLFLAHKGGRHVA